MELQNLSSNWKQLQERLGKNNGDTSQPLCAKRQAPDSKSQQNGFKKRRITNIIHKKIELPGYLPRRTSMFEDGTVEEAKETARRYSTGPIQISEPQNAKINEGLSPTAEIGKYVAVDCEMVGVGPDPDKESALARVSIVNWNGDQVYDSFVKPKEKVTDWRTSISGVSAKEMEHARPLEEVQKDVAKILEGTVLVGHALRNDLNALLLSHPRRDIRDTSKHPPYRKIAGGNSPRLKVLAAELLGLEIQGGSHSSIEDARATMLLFRRDKEGFDREHAKRWPMRVIAENQTNEEKNLKKRKKKKKKNRKR